jgi:hypothetical protein
MNPQEQPEPPAAGFVVGDRVRHSFSKEVHGLIIQVRRRVNGYDYFVKWDNAEYGRDWYTPAALELAEPAEAEKPIFMSNMSSRPNFTTVKRLVLAKQIEALEEVQAAYDQKLDPWDAIHKMGELIQLKKKELKEL